MTERASSRLPRLPASWRRRLWRVVLASAVLLALLVVALAVLRSRLDAPAPTLLLRDRHGHFLAEVGGSDTTGYGYWRLGELPPRVVAATLAVEDRRFRSHPGVDPVAVVRAAWQNLRSGRVVSGASTLAMQVARMQDPGPRTLPRKVVEAATAVLLTVRHGRRAVLGWYLTIVPYGHQIHGIRYAARRYLDKPVEDLSWAEVAFLAAIPQAPGRMDPFDPRGRHRAMERGRRILDLLLAEGEFGRAAHRRAVEEIVRLRIPWPRRRPESTLHTVLRFEERLGEESFREEVADRPLMTTTLDLGLTRRLARRVRRAVERWEGRGAGNAAALVVDLDAGAVRAAVGSAGYFDGRRSGALDYTRVRRSPGSALKPFIYALALERGVITPATVVDDLGRGAGGISNDDGRFLGPLLPRAALANSRNVPAADLLAEVGLDETHAFLEELGLHAGAVPAGHYGAGLALGGLPVTLEDLVGAYTALAGDGVWSPPVWYRGERRRRRRVLSEATARRLALFLSDPMARLPSFPRMGPTEYPFPVAVKTGTSSGYHDAWAVAYSRRTLVGVWIGHPDHRPMYGVSGYRSAARLAREVLLLAPGDAVDGLADGSFPPPRGTRPVRLCALTGKRPAPACERVVSEPLRPGEVPVARCDVHVERAVDRRTGGLATAATPPRHVAVESFVDLPPRYARWAVRHGLRPPPRPPGLGGWPAGLGTPGRPGAPVGTPRRISVTAPEDGLRLLRDPETPAALATLGLTAVVEPPSEQVVWYVDGEPWRVVDSPYGARWPLEAGEHSFQARIPYTDVRSRVVRVRVE